MTTKTKSIEANDHKLVITRDFDAPRDLVWKAWTEPGQIKEWLRMGEGMTIESVKADVRVGGRFRIQQKMDDGEFFTAAGTYLEVKPPERLVYTWDWEKDGGGTEFGEVEGKPSLITIEFLKRGNQTELVLTHSRFASVQSRDNHAEGWGRGVESFARFVEGLS